jgi:hypothetical protein
VPDYNANNYNHSGNSTQARKLPFRILLCGRTHYFPQRLEPFLIQARYLSARMTFYDVVRE